MKDIRLSLGTVLVVTTSLVAWIAITAEPTLAADEPSAKERELIAILQSEDSPAADKAITCKHLAVHGSSAAVPELAKLLGDERLSSWTRIALEAIPGPEADAALRDATASLSGNLLIGTINSIGVRRDRKAVEILTARLEDPNVDVAAAAAVALGRIGTADAAKALRPLVATAPEPLRTYIAEGAVLCAERILAAGDQATAIAMYDEIRQSPVVKQRILEATRGAILARKPEAGIALLLEQFRSNDQALFYIGLSTAREFPGSAVDKALAEELTKIQPERAPLLIHAMADRKDTVVLAALLKAAAAGPKPVRLTAINALSRVGDASCLLTLLQVAVEPDEELVQASRLALGNLPGDNVDKTVIARLAKPDPKIYRVLLELVGQRRIEAVPELLKAVDHQDKTIRAAALTSLGATVSPKTLPSLISQVVSSKHAEDAPVAQLALKTACVRMPDPDACSQELTTAMDRAPIATKTVLLNILGSVGGTKALKTVALAAKSNDPDLQDTATKLLGDWLTIDSAPVILDLAKTMPEGKFQNRVIKGYFRIARQFEMADPERIEMCQKGIDASRKLDEQKLVLDVVRRYPSMGMFQLALKLAKDLPDLKDDLIQATLVSAGKLTDKQSDAIDLLAKADLTKVKVEVLKAEYGAGNSLKDVTETVQKQVGDTQLIQLPQANYNESFGGDPAPNAKKQLRIQYRINGKDGNVALNENALVILPMPK